MRILTLTTLLAIVSFSITASAKSNEDEKSASAVPDRLFSAMQKKDASAIKNLFIASGQLIAIQKPRDGKGESSLRNFTGDSFAKLIVGSKAEYIEKMPSKDVKVTGDMAIVTGRYTFYIGKTFSHCGTNTFNLARTKDGWKIANATSTIELDCGKDLKAIPIPKIDAATEDVSTIDGIISALYESISGGIGKEREWGRDRTLYTPGIRFVTINSDKNRSRIRRITHRQYVDNNNEFLVKSGFVEREIHRVTNRFGNLAQVFSTYVWETADKKNSGRGINSITLFFDGNRWWISSLSWENEHAGNKIPSGFLPSRNQANLR